MDLLTERPTFNVTHDSLIRVVPADNRTSGVVEILAADVVRMAEVRTELMCQVMDLAMLVRRMSRQLEGSQICQQAQDYLKRQNLDGSRLRTGPTA